MITFSTSTNPSNTKPYKMSLRTKIVKEVAKLKKGLTCEQIEKRLGAKHQTVSSALNALYKEGSIYRTGATRTTTSGRLAKIWSVCNDMYDED